MLYDNQKGIYLNEVNRKYPRSSQMLGYDVLLDTDSMYKPKVISSFEMIVNSILTILFMKPGQYPSIPELGINIESYLFEYGDDKNIPKEIQAKLRDQCNLIDISGVEFSISMDTTSDGSTALILQISGNDYICAGLPSNRMVVGITYSKLNEVYMRKVYMERSAKT